MSRNFILHLSKRYFRTAADKCCLVFSQWCNKERVPDQLITMKTLAILLSCLLPVVLCWDFPGYPGVDCPTAREKMAHRTPQNQWMLPKCNADGTYQDLQCYDEYPDVPDTCMCTALDGSPLTLPGFGLNIKTCVCLLEQYRIFEHGIFYFYLFELIQ
ncbi:u36-Nephitoxin-Nsp1a_1 [Trichonephila inaurata madagascariensis]|uniref:U36-Nephitoxin-Nsp1a_1 n=1 Tax=Trichonephila inaurata madagascariensis TaxID=2747483 RepID=A0A8X6IAT6_9ARAC|nr:u36-Nephitoxin-Nsp1a_1 [Trichonephila inaurata madagascariensis]